MIKFNIFGKVEYSNKGDHWNHVLRLYDKNDTLLKESGPFHPEGMIIADYKGNRFISPSVGSLGHPDDRMVLIVLPDKS